jgi:hypothetical protein
MAPELPVVYSAQIAEDKQKKVAAEPVHLAAISTTDD